MKQNKVTFWTYHFCRQSGMYVYHKHVPPQLQKVGQMRVTGQDSSRGRVKMLQPRLRATDEVNDLHFGTKPAKFEDNLGICPKNE